MRLSGLRSTEVQGMLWPVPLGNHGHARNVIGALCERLTASLVGGSVHKTDCTADYCPDVSTAARFYESKAAGRTRQTFVYAGRLGKDRTFVAAGNPLAYVIWHHLADTLQAGTVGQLEDLVLARMVDVRVVPFGVLDRLCGGMAPKRLNAKYGGSLDRPEYGSGYRIRLALLDEFVVLRFPHGISDRTREVWLAGGT